MSRSFEIPEPLRDSLHQAARSEGNLVVLTGAGISAESGIPTFRGPEGYWSVGSRNYHPQELATAAAFAAMPREVWRWYLFRRSVCRQAMPNAGHEALVALEKAFGDRFVLVTQNVDGLHLRAGNRAQRTLQIHGNIDFFRCAERCCDDTWPLPESMPLLDRGDALPEDAWDRLVCPGCSGRARPHVLWFDECYDEALFRAQTALERAREAALLMVVGTSGATNLPMQIGVMAARLARPIIDVNLDPGPFSELAARTEASGGHIVRAPASVAVPRLVQALCEGV